MKCARLTAVLLFLLCVSIQTPRAEEKESAVQQVRTLLHDRCVKCHSGEKPKAGLNLASLEALSRGSKRGPVVVAGKPAESPLWQAVEEERMPPKMPLPPAERALLRRWIEQGAPGLTAAAKVHWAFVPPVRPELPNVKTQNRVRTAVDRFLLAALEKKGLTFAPETDRPTLARRLAFDLTGLPPTPDEVAAFVSDRSPDAYEKLVEHYLASPHYGERWGKYWLDAAGYADSNGYFSADSDRPYAWRYRDYVIRSFNADKPYDRFVQEQLAGDEMVGFTPDGPVTPDMVDPLIATHFLRNAPDGTGESDGNPDEVRTDRYTVLEGTLQNTMNCLLGITIQCARCHEHKFEPIAHDEYYRLEAVFFPGYNPERWSPPKNRIVTIATPAERAEHRRRTEQIDRQIKALQQGLQDIAAPLRDQLLEERVRDQAKAEWQAALAALRTPEDKRTESQKALAAKYKAAASITDTELRRRFPEFAALEDQAKKAGDQREKEKPRPLETLSVFVETDPNPPVHHVLLRGQHNAPGPEVQPGVPAAFCTEHNRYLLGPRPTGKISSGRRTAFARWVTSPENPLFTRVMVNRIWQHHFGVGLVATPDNLGQSGTKPSHPELLDYLATEFVRSGWSIKAMHRLIVNSSAYRQASSTQYAVLSTQSKNGGVKRTELSSSTQPSVLDTEPKNRAGKGSQPSLSTQDSVLGAPSSIDPDNRLLWHFPLRRLDAEAIRDAMLAISGELDRHPGGPFVRTERNAEGSVIVKESQPGAHRRSVYLQQRRTQVLTMLELFDAPSIVSTCGTRTTSTVPLQSLALLNSEFARTRAVAFANRLEREVGAAENQRIERAFRLVSGRAPTLEEASAARRFLAEQRVQYEKEKDGDQQAWTDFCQMILASNAFLYIE